MRSRPSYAFEGVRSDAGRRRLRGTIPPLHFRGGLMVVTRIAPMSVARIAGVLYALMGLVFGGFVSLASIGGAMTGTAEGALGGMMAFGAAAVFMFPIIYGFFGFLMTLIGAALYNVLAGVLGGIEIETQ